MRHVHSESQFRHALYSLQDSDGYVDALLAMAREQSACERSQLSTTRFEGRPRLQFRPRPKPNAS
jgi:hypothetical protein